MKKSCRWIGNYFLDPMDGWVRPKSLDRLCSEQRALQTWERNPSCRGRNFALCSKDRIKRLAKQDMEKGVIDPFLSMHSIYKDYIEGQCK